MKNLQYVFGAVVVVALAGFGWWYAHQHIEIQPYALQLKAGDTVASWDFKGAYAGDAALAKRAADEIARLKTLFGTKDATDYEIYVSIANQYSLLGDGANDFLYLKKALAVDSMHTGLAWYNVAVLLSRLGALHTARFAYEHAVGAQGLPQYQNALADFLKEHLDVSD